MVGTPCMTVTRSRSRIRRAAEGSNRGRSVTQAPVSTAALSPQVCPKTWKKGRPPKTVSVPVMPRSPLTVSVLLRRLPWVRTAPFGRPVVPEV